MLMIEYVNIHSHGKWFTKLRQNRFGQVVLGAGLGIIPGCMGGFAAVSMYSHKLLSFGALIAMMIASSGDEAFVMLAMIPKEALLLMAVLFAVAILVGWLVDRFSKQNVKVQHEGCEDGYQIHDEDHHDETHQPEKASFRNMRHASAERIALLLGVILFIAALAFGILEHEHEHEEAEAHLWQLDGLQFNAKCCCDDFDSKIQFTDNFVFSTDKHLIVSLQSFVLPHLDLTKLYDEVSVIYNNHSQRKTLKFLSGQDRIVFFSSLKLNPLVF
jgi:hypothetical protein